jgi:PAS domain S-box-containing protein
VTENPFDDPSESDPEFRRATLYRITLLVAVVASVLTVVVYFTHPNQVEAAGALLIACVNWVLLLRIRRGNATYLPHVMVFAVLTAASVAAVANGSVRTAGSFLYVGAVAGAGIFLGRNALIGSVLYSVVSLGLLNLAEQNGLLRKPNFDVGLAVWLTHSTVLVVVAILVYYSRMRARAAYAQQTTELLLRKRTEQERDRNNERFMHIFHNSPSAMLAQSATNGIILDVNPAFERCFGHAREHVLGRSDGFLWACQDERSAYLLALNATRHAAPRAVTGLRADGSTFDALISSELSKDHEDRLLITTIADITKERRREALLLRVAQGMTGETGVAFFSALTRHMAEVLEADVVLVSELQLDSRMHAMAVWKDGAPGASFHYPLDGSPCQEALLQQSLCVYADHVLDRYPVIQDLLGRPAAAYVGQSLRDHDGTEIGVISAMWYQPITPSAEMHALFSIFSSRATAEMIRTQRDREIHQFNATLEQRVRQRTAELEKLNAELDSFAYSVSHDLKSPLRAIDGFTRLLAEELSESMTKDQQLLFDRVLSSTQRMSTLIADLLGLARVSQGLVEPGPTDLSQIAQEVLLTEQSKHPERPLKWQIAPRIVAECDPRLARIALENLLGNAVKYTRDQPAPMIEFGRMPPGGPHAGLLFVRDNGVGFNMKFADKLFKPFQRLHMPSEFEGTGIGLATVRRIVERHGGHIEGSSQPGNGAEFLFSLGPVPSSP